MARVILIGELYNADLQVGGGPVYPPAGGGRPPGPVDPGYSPPWARPPVDPGYSPPWARPPVDPGYNPPGVGPGVPGTRPPIGSVDPGFGNPWFDPHPAHPIYFPPPNLPIDPGYSPPWAQVPDLPPTVPPAEGPGGEPVPVVWKTAWTPTTGWVVIGVPTGSVPTPSSA